METSELHRVNLHQFLVGQSGKFVTVDFTKLSGEPRSLNGRLEVRKHLRAMPPRHRLPVNEKISRTLWCTMCKPLVTGL